MGGLQLMKINEIHRGNHVADQRDLSDFGLATHRSRDRNGSGLERELGLPGVMQARCEEPAADGNVPTSLPAKGANRLRS